MQPTELVAVMAAIIYSGRKSGGGKKAADATAKAQRSGDRGLAALASHARAVDGFRRAPVPGSQSSSVAVRGNLTPRARRSRRRSPRGSSGNSPTGIAPDSRASWHQPVLWGSCVRRRAPSVQ